MEMLENKITRRKEKNILLQLSSKPNIATKEIKFLLSSIIIRK
jgi:hypothetical protein